MSTRTAHLIFGSCRGNKLVVSRCSNQFMASSWRGWDRSVDTGAHVGASSLVNLIVNTFKIRANKVLLLGAWYRLIDRSQRLLLLLLIHHIVQIACVALQTLSDPDYGLIELTLIRCLVWNSFAMAACRIDQLLVSFPRDLHLGLRMLTIKEDIADVSTLIICCCGVTHEHCFSYSFGWPERKAYSCSCGLELRNISLISAFICRACLVRRALILRVIHQILNGQTVIEFSH